MNVRLKYPWNFQINLTLCLVINGIFIWRRYFRLWSSGQWNGNCYFRFKIGILILRKTFNRRNKTSASDFCFWPKKRCSTDVWTVSCKMRTRSEKNCTIYPYSQWFVWKVKHQLMQLKWNFSQIVSLARRWKRNFHVNWRIIMKQLQLVSSKWWRVWVIVLFCFLLLFLFVWLPQKPSWKNNSSNFRMCFSLLVSRFLSILMAKKDMSDYGVCRSI